MYPPEGIAQEHAGSPQSCIALSPIMSKFESDYLNCIDLTWTTPEKTKPRKRKPNTHRAVSASLKKTAKPKCDVRDGITKATNGCPYQQGPLQNVERYLMRFGDVLAHQVQHPIVKYADAD